MQKIFSSRTHGILDYATAGLLLALPRMLGWSTAVRRVMTGMALATLGYSALTDYELGLIKALPFTGHLALDRANGALFCAGPLLFRGEPGSVRAGMLGIGLFELTAVMLTDPVAFKGGAEQLAAVKQDQ